MNGWIKKWRKEVNGAVWEMPPLYYKVWSWLLYRADYETGVVRTSLSSIADAVAWVEDGRYRTPNRKTIRSILLRLEGNTMVGVDSNRDGTTITIMNWHSYQGAKAEEVTPNGQVEETTIGLPSGLPSGHGVRSTRSSRTEPVQQPATEVLSSSQEAKQPSERAVMLMGSIIKSLGVMWPADRWVGVYLDNHFADGPDWLTDEVLLTHIEQNADAIRTKSWRYIVGNGDPTSGVIGRMIDGGPPEREKLKQSGTCPRCKVDMQKRHYLDNNTSVGQSWRGFPIYECLKCGHKQRRDAGLQPEPV